MCWIWRVPWIPRVEVKRGESQIVCTLLHGCWVSLDLPHDSSDVGSDFLRPEIFLEGLSFVPVEAWAERICFQSVPHWYQRIESARDRSYVIDSASGSVSRIRQKAALA